MRKASSSSVKPSVTAPENTTHFTFFEIYSMDEMPNWRSVIRMIRTYQNEIQYVTMHDKNMKRHSNCIMFRKTNNRTIPSQNVDLSVNFKAVLHLRICAALKSLKLDSIQLPPLKKTAKVVAVPTRRNMLSWGALKDTGTDLQLCTLQNALSVSLQLKLFSTQVNEINFRIQG